MYSTLHRTMTPFPGFSPTKRRRLCATPGFESLQAGFFVFPDLSVRTEGTYRLKLTLFEVIGANVHHCKSIFSAPFYVYTAKKFPGMEG